MRYSKSFTILSSIWLQAHGIALVLFNLLTLTLEGSGFYFHGSHVIEAVKELNVDRGRQEREPTYRIKRKKLRKN